MNEREDHSPVDQADKDRAQSVIHIRRDNWFNAAVFGVAIAFATLVYSIFHNFSSDIAGAFERFQREVSKVIDAQNDHIKALEERILYLERRRR